MTITLPELEDAINYWRAQRPAMGEEGALSREVNALATVYAHMIYYRSRQVAVEDLDDEVRRLIAQWRERQPPSVSRTGA